MTTDIKHVAEAMKEIDFCMMTTVDGNGTMHGRPMSNNTEVEFDGDTYFFTYHDTKKVRDLETTPRVSLAYASPDMTFIHLYGDAAILEDKELMEKHWNKGLMQWFPEGIETEGIRILRVTCDYVRYWTKDGEGEINLRK